MINLDTLEYWIYDRNDTHSYTFGQLVTKYGRDGDIILTPAIWSVQCIYELERSEKKAHFYPYPEANVSTALILMLAKSDGVLIEARGTIRGAVKRKIPLKDVWPLLLTPAEELFDD